MSGKPKSGLGSTIQSSIGMGLKGRINENLELELSALANELEQADAEFEPQEDAPEAHEVQASGVSEGVLEERPDISDFEAARKGRRAWFQQNEFARPPVEFWIDLEANVHALGRQRDFLDAIRLSIARAVARYLAPDIDSLATPGAWCHVQAIGSIEQLKLLASQEGIVTREELDSQLENKGKKAASFAILLPSGEAITPKALVMPASKAKRATLAGALRLSASRPEQIAGEPWMSLDWERFEHSQATSQNREPVPGLGKKRL
jgi:hypothetical protein